MPAYFASDIHLRLDKPERGKRLARWVKTLGGGDRLTVVGDLCDFWFSSREQSLWKGQCEGLRSLQEFMERGGELTIIPGNHDAWLGPFYQRNLNTQLLDADYLDVEEGGLRLRLLHGHRLGARSRWKGWMESRAFLEGFSRLPEFSARSFDRLLVKNNQTHQADVHRRHLAVYKDYAASLRGQKDLVIFGHVHEVFDLEDLDPRLIVLGHWFERTSYLKVDDQGVLFIQEEDPRPLRQSMGQNA